MEVSQIFERSRQMLTVVDTRTYHYLSVNLQTMGFKPGEMVKNFSGAIILK